ncbi:MAG: cellulase family glycosylhydrolase [Melioribacteraceae bacterium]|nr:cellulase family glycosylhydrolase [Melioribacteraceae bacterium]
MEKPFENFISVKGNQLMDGDSLFRFLSFNIPNLNFVEDEMNFTTLHPFRLPVSYEIRDALMSVKQIGGQVVRSYTLPVRRESDTPDIPRYVIGPGEFDENSFKVMDTVLAIANEAGIRLIVPLLNNWKWMGGVPQYAAFRGKLPEEFWTDSLLIEDFKKTIEYTLNRTNTASGIKYKDDKAILCWETGNELSSPYSWTKEIVSHIKSIDTNHLVMDGFNAIDGIDIPNESIEDSLIDILTTHHYKLNPDEIISDIRKQLVRINGKKPYIIGEYGFLGTGAIEQISDYIINNGISGGLLWSLRFHRREGGFYWHTEPLGGGIFKAFHYPGFSSGREYNEEDLMTMFRDKAFQIKGLKPLPDQIPDPPELFPIHKPSEISWQGSVGAKYYDVERSVSPDGNWIIVGYNVSDACQYYTPLFNDYSAQYGQQYFYRVIAKNIAGESDPSNVVGPVKTSGRTLADDFRNMTVMYFYEGDINLISRNEREFKEIKHRLESNEGSAVYYYVPGTIKSVRINLFTQEDTTSLSLSLSEDFKVYDKQSIERKSYFMGKGDYNYWIPSQYYSSVNDTAKSYRYVKISIEKTTQLARVEIEYKPENIK